MLVRPQVANSDLRKTHIYRSHSRQTLGPVQEFGSSMVLKTPSHSPCTRQGLVFPETHSTVLQTFETPAPRKASQTLCSQFFRAPPLFVTCVGTQVGRGLGNDVPQTERARESKHNVLSKDFFRFPPFFGAKCGHGWIAKKTVINKKHVLVPKCCPKWFSHLLACFSLQESQEHFQCTVTHIAGITIRGSHTWKKQQSGPLGPNCLRRIWRQTRRTACRGISPDFTITLTVGTNLPNLNTNANVKLLTAPFSRAQFTRMQRDKQFYSAISTQCTRHTEEH